MRHKLVAALAVLVLLGGCHRAAGPAVTPTPTATPTSSPELPAGPTELWGFPIDDTHDAFEVDTGGKLGTVLVTVERGEEDTEGLDGYHYTLSVWNKDDLTTPIQTFKETSFDLHNTCGYWNELEDANFDGYTDFFYVWNRHVSNLDFSLYLWDEVQEKFVFETSLVVRGVGVDQETQTVSTFGYFAGTYRDETYRWENRELVCFQREEYGDDDHVTYELINGEWKETSRKPMLG